MFLTHFSLIVQEMLYILDSMEELKLRLLSDDFGKHLMGVEDLLQKHSLVEADINVLGERVKQVVQHSQRFLGKRNQVAAFQHG
jgi:spectrin beta